MTPALPISAFFTLTAQNNLILVFLHKWGCISSFYAVWESGPLTFSQISSYDFASELWKEWAWGSLPRRHGDFPRKASPYWSVFGSSVWKGFLLSLREWAYSQSPGTHSCCNKATAHFTQASFLPTVPWGSKCEMLFLFPEIRACAWPRRLEVFSICAWGTVISRGAISIVCREWILFKHTAFLFRGGLRQLTSNVWKFCQKSFTSGENSVDL